MFILNEDRSIYATRGDIVFFDVSAEDELTGINHKFLAGDVLRIKVYGKKDAEAVVLQKDFPVTEVTEKVTIFLTEEDTKMGEVISKPKDYWYEVELNPFDNPQTIIGYDEDGPKVFKLFPEGDDLPEWTPEPEDIPIVDELLDMTSTRPIQNQAVARAVASLEEGYEKVFEAVAEKFVTPQMFGAIGDGEANDTEALQQTLNSGYAVTLTPGIYRTTETLRVPKGCRITGDKNCVIMPECVAAFHLQEESVLSGFTVEVKSENVLTVFEVNDDSIANSSMLEILIDNVTVNHSGDVTPEMYTVCHFHADKAGFYGVTVRGCTFSNYPAGGYVARVYSALPAWVSTIVFDGNNTRAFKWHYFFDKSEKEFVNDHNNSCIVTNCVAQCVAETSGFIFVNSADSVTFTNNVPWDWLKSENCPGSPYVIGPNVTIGGANTFARQPNNSEILGPDEMCRYDGESYAVVPYSRQDLVSAMGGRYNAALIPKFIGLGRSNVICLYNGQSSNGDRRIRFYWCDGFGVTYVSVSIKSKTVNVSQPLYSDLCFGLSSDNKRLYVYMKSGGKLPAYAGVITMPVANSSLTFGMEGSPTPNVEHTPNCDLHIETCGLDALPGDVTALPVRLAQPAYASDDSGTIYSLTVVDDGNGNKSVSVKKAWEPSNEEA